MQKKLYLSKFMYIRIKEQQRVERFSCLAIIKPTNKHNFCNIIANSQFPIIFIVKELFLCHSDIHGNTDM